MDRPSPARPATIDAGTTQRSGWSIHGGVDVVRATRTLVTLAIGHLLECRGRRAGADVGGFTTGELAQHPGERVGGAEDRLCQYSAGVAREGRGNLLVSQ